MLFDNDVFFCSKKLKENWIRLKLSFVNFQLCRNLSFTKEVEPSRPIPPVQNPFTYDNVLTSSQEQPSTEMDPMRLSPYPLLEQTYPTCLDSTQNSRLGTIPLINENEVLGPMMGPYSINIGSSQTGLCKNLIIFS